MSRVQTVKLSLPAEVRSRGRDSAEDRRRVRETDGSSKGWAQTPGGTPSASAASATQAASGGPKPTDPATPCGTAPSCSLLPLSLPLTLLFPPFLSPRPVNGTQGHGSVPQGHPVLPDAGLGMGRCTCGAVSLVPVPDPAVRWRPGQGAPVPSCA